MKKVGYLAALTVLSGFCLFANVTDEERVYESAIAQVDQEDLGENNLLPPPDEEVEAFSMRKPLNPKNTC